MSGKTGKRGRKRGPASHAQTPPPGKGDTSKQKTNNRCRLKPTGYGHLPTTKIGKAWGKPKTLALKTPPALASSVGLPPSLRSVGTVLTTASTQHNPSNHTTHKTAQPPGDNHQTQQPPKRVTPYRTTNRYLQPRCASAHPRFGCADCSTGVGCRSVGVLRRDRTKLGGRPGGGVAWQVVRLSVVGGRCLVVGGGGCSTVGDVAAVGDRKRPRISPGPFLGVWVVGGG